MQRPQINRTGRIGKLDFFFLKSAFDGEIDFLLGVHVFLVIAGVEKINNFVVEAEVREFFKMNSVGLAAFYSLNDFFHHGRDFFEFGLGGFVSDTEDKADAAFFHFAVILDVGASEFIIGHDYFFAFKGSDAGGFDTDSFNGAFFVTDNNEIADFERFIKINGKGTENIAEDILEG